MPKRFRLVPVVVCLCLFGPGVPPAHSADVAGKKTIVEHARAAYVNLRRAGLVEFRATVQPNWNLALKDQLQKDPVGAQAALSAFTGLHFTVRLDPQDGVTVEHRYDAPAPTGAALQQFDQLAGGVEGSITGFFQTWASFMLRSPFPPVDGDYHLEDTGTQYRLSFKAGTLDAQTTMGKDFLITRLDFAGKDFTSWVKPQLKKSSLGYVLTGFTTFYQATGSTDTTQISAKLDYQAAGGLPLPKTLAVVGSQNGTLGPPAEYQLTDYHITNR